jgi:putative tryptophan/tyrosine transport system substrate-binding protein
MQRREFIAGLAGVAAWPVVSRAQSMPVVGLLSVTEYRGSDRLLAFERGLAEKGFFEGTNVVLEYGVEGRVERIPGLTADFVRRRVGVIVTFGSTALALAAKAATQTVPVVFILGSDPVEAGLIASLARPGGNLTGVTLITAETVAKRFDLMRQMVPSAASAALLVNPDNPYSKFEAREFERAAQERGIRPQILTARDGSELEKAFASLAQNDIGMLLTGADPIFSKSGVTSLVFLAARYAVPTSYEYSDAVAAGGLMSYGPLILEEFRQLGIYTGRILRGDKPADLPVMEPTKFDLAINLKTAKTLGLTVPETLLATADEVIQ